MQNLSHELKTPIFAIQGYVDTLINGALENPDVNKKFLNSTSRNIDRLVNLVDDLDEISKLERGEQQLYKENFIIQELVKDVYESLLIKAEKKQIRMLLKKGCEVPLTVYADKEKIRQVFINLAENSIKYGKQNGTIEASAYKIDGKRILIEISDDGNGISERQLRDIEDSLLWILSLGSLAKESRHRNGEESCKIGHKHYGGHVGHERD